MHITTCEVIKRQFRGKEFRLAMWFLRIEVGFHLTRTFHSEPCYRVMLTFVSKKIDIVYKMSDTLETKFVYNRFTHINTQKINLNKYLHHFLSGNREYVFSRGL